MTYQDRWPSISFINETKKYTIFKEKVVANTRMPNGEGDCQWWRGNESTNFKRKCPNADCVTTARLLICVAV